MLRQGEFVVNFSTSPYLILIKIRNQETGKVAAVVCENSNWAEVAVEEYGLKRDEYVDFMLKTHQLDRIYDVSAENLEKLTKYGLAILSPEQIDDKKKGLKHLVNKYVEVKEQKYKMPGEPSEKTRRSYLLKDQYNNNNGAKRLLLEEGLKLQRGCPAYYFIVYGIDESKL